ncbi:GNAT family N-acetyltransferase [Aeromicrobium terrae]|uniref:GNAT family N-acetyltransferase n=1 Tax=Aeromicrobium terrae TaxID=2498846 RepID=A0A5C8NJY7_9ACTN|nr:GNAT family N-acetyltransferase [Aeromicrobium terrae]TXL61175.1 GNAT family N-acetyltransferase [Aeromicrobium terrae]
MSDVRRVDGDRLTAQDVYDIWKIRDAVFSVEQRCEVEDVDGKDLLPETTHFWTEDEDGPTSYLRVYVADDGERRIGRVCTRRDQRGRGLSTALMEEVHRLWGDGRLGLNAQAYLERWYEGFGYERCGENFMEAGIPHVPMRRRLPEM